jgi:mRNA-degrading endonuclease toxin of MazEF toxin-antitoxin module
MAFPMAFIMAGVYGRKDIPRAILLSKQNRYWKSTESNNIISLYKDRLIKNLGSISEEKMKEVVEKVKLLL